MKLNLAEILRQLNNICPANAPEISDGRLAQTEAGLVSAGQPLNGYALEFLEDRLAAALARVRAARRPRKPKFPVLTEAEKELILAGKTGGAR